MKYFYAALGAVYGVVIGSIGFLLIVPILFYIYLIPLIKEKPASIFLLAVLAIGVVECLMLGSLFFGIFLGIETAKAAYNHGWKAWLAPFKLIGVYLFGQYHGARFETEAANNIIDLSEDEKRRRAVIIVEDRAIKTNHTIKQNIDRNLKTRITEGDKAFPIELSAIITVYATEEYKPKNGELGIGKDDAVNIAEKSLNNDIHQSHAHPSVLRSNQMF